MATKIQLKVVKWLLEGRIEFKTHQYDKLCGFSIFQNITINGKSLDGFYFRRSDDEYDMVHSIHVDYKGSVTSTITKHNYKGEKTEETEYWSPLKDK